HLVSEEVCGAFRLDHAGVFDEVRGFRGDGVENVTTDAVERAGAEPAIQIKETEKAVRVAPPERNGDNAAELMSNDALAAERLAFSADIADEVLLAGECRIADDGTGDLGVIGEDMAFLVEAALKAQSGGAVAEEDEAAFGPCEAEGIFDHGAEN